LIKDETQMSQARCRITELLGVDQDPQVFFHMLEERYTGYRKWALDTMREAPEAELWTRWLVPDLPAGQVAPLGTELTYQYRRALGRRVVVEQGRDVIVELQQRGYILGIISNLIGTREIGEWLQNEGFSTYFSSVALSSVLGVRKPDPAIYAEAACQAGVAAENCAYIGDNYKRDVIGTRNAGFGEIILIIPPEKLPGEQIPPEYQPDLILHDFRELLDHYPSRLSSAESSCSR
jgi:HAD superfamily hydrolase (TIGR01549 family)